MPVMTSSRDTCPDACPFKTKGCYASTGPLALHWDKVDSGERGRSLDEALKPIRRLNWGAFWRYGQAGDLPGKGDEIDADAVRQIAKANTGKRAIVFTHKPPTPKNLNILREVRDQGLVINLSANSLSHADELAATGLPVVVVLPTTYGRNKDESLSDFRKRIRTLPRRTRSGRKIAICPATYHDVSCTECGVCANGDRNDAVIGFPAHGTYKKHVSNVALTSAYAGPTSPVP